MQLLLLFILLSIIIENRHIFNAWLLVTIYSCRDDPQSALQTFRYICCWDPCHVPAGFPRAPPPFDVQPARSFSIHCNWYAPHTSTCLQATKQSFRAAIFQSLAAYSANARVSAWWNRTHGFINVRTVLPFRTTLSYFPVSIYVYGWAGVTQSL
jgi:hypothetical protein